jgi:hypothetical protein
MKIKLTFWYTWSRLDFEIDAQGRLPACAYSLRRFHAQGALDSFGSESRHPRS